MDEVVLSVGGTRFEGWESVAISRSMEQGPHDFELALTNTWRSLRHREIRAGESVRLSIGNDVVISGDIDDLQPDYDAERVQLAVAGRSRLADLVDCSTVGKSFSRQSLDAIARAICEPFGIEVVVSIDAGAAFANVVLDEGQSPWEFLDYLARVRGVRLMGDESGRLIITGPGNRLAARPLVLGDNIVSGRGQFTFRSRFAEYLVVSRNGDTYLGDAESTTSIAGKAADMGVRRYRPTVIVADDDCTPAECQAQAEWQRNTAWGRGQSVVYTVRGWREQPGGQVWTPNTRVMVDDPYMGVKEERLLVEVRLLLDDQGQRSELMVMPREAMLRKPLPEPKSEDEV